MAELRKWDTARKHGQKMKIAELRCCEEYRVIENLITPLLAKYPPFEHRVNAVMFLREIRFPTASFVLRFRKTVEDELRSLSHQEQHITKVKGQPIVEAYVRVNQAVSQGRPSAEAPRKVKP